MKLLQFTAEWCQGCKTVEAAIERLKGEWNVPVAFERIDVAKEGGVATRYRVATLPTCIIVDDGGAEIARVSAALGYEELKEFIVEAVV